ncbi:DUF3160 domain-containing protein [Deinococcus metallilatus]|uniref:DUF3160 domain-containing protein n=1 Tax=Deinococcus metallilatus TaxID=1211322 RepID=A0AAJ5F056_9DEIO|nr:DUF3160 domain-containing protein [Deinococcus metallilatus]MBB5297339.1 hypothetical protein [Deinococcus metallilatus]QBY10116.1 DUF3160 domain-containing protein [Deinococcus metallilatus]RXJ08276.1 DUF3160 domain-containing protein [Deinococcus metallilatus]TLK21183.1 DUF3160 domain-containing protein [Deinococcus metallilatus]GMA17096.1 hypothetical protein GCM10025871_34270 [Deinococcus metallilatus]
MPRSRPALTLTLLLALSGGMAGAASTYTLPVNLNSLKNPAVLRGNKETGLAPLNAAQRAALAQQGFVIVPAGWRQFDAVYEATRYADQPVFVTTDAVLHVYHLVFDKLLRDLERETLAPTTRRLTALLVEGARRQAQALAGTPLEDDARRALAYLAVAQKLDDPSSPVPAEVAPLVTAELKLIKAHSGLAPSPIFAGSQMIEDYSQYVPRGHYTRSEALQRYFRTMMWLGRMNLRVGDASETRTAALVAHLISGNPEAQKLWARLYDPTALLIGTSDDLNERQYAATLQAVTGGNIRQLADPQKLAAFQAALAKLPPPRVNSVFVVARPGEGVDVRQRETLGFRLMGQRFTLDGAALQQLVYREVGTEQKPRTLPRGLDLLAAMGSDAALNELRRLGDTQYAHYETQMQKVRAQFAALKPQDWNANVYSGWLYVLQALAKPEARDDRFPAFMRTPAWTRKEMLTALGSWTELRHDTLLYAKQVMAEMGAGGEPELPRGYVEPNGAVWSRLLALEALTRRVLTDQKILSERTANNLGSLRDMLTFLNAATAKELAGQPLTRDEYDRIHFFGGWLEQMKLASTDPEGNEEGGTPTFDEPPYAGVVADVATDAGRGRVLEEATGTIHELYAVVPNGRGGLQVARGGVYSQYEFTVPLSGRLTDEAWRARLKVGQLPAMHPWLEGVVVK